MRLEKPNLPQLLAVLGELGKGARSLTAAEFQRRRDAHMARTPSPRSPSVAGSGTAATGREAKAGVATNAKQAAAIMVHARMMIILGSVGDTEGGPPGGSSPARRRSKI